MSETEIESLDAFRERARAHIRANLEHVGARVVSLRDRSDEDELAGVARDREVQRILFEGGLAGVVVPQEYGGQGLTPAHQKVLQEELAGYEYPMRFQAPTMNPCMAVLLDFADDEQKRRHVPAILRGEEIWMQFLSEPGNGSDLAGVTTTAVRDGDEWVLNGSKVWTTGAWWSDWGLCLARTNWDVPKHRGLTVFMVPIDREGIEVHRIEMLNGNKEFCQEFFTDVRVPDTDRVGEVDDGWTVVTRWLFHERMLYNSPYVTIPVGTARVGDGGGSMLDLARQAGRADDPAARELVGEATMLNLAVGALSRRVATGIASGAVSDQIAAAAKLFGAIAGTRRMTIGFELAGSNGAAWDDDDGDLAETGNDFLMRQVGCIGGGTTEMAANVVAERVLGMPRERSFDRDVPFREVPRGAS
ncbi:MAG TPA: acyl-CoA dehydrogenase family protein [Acidimicrobiales bacterium]|nr:acyl-CoA dehydrogenase family protein [Acidimicrobiales bacterium]